MASFTRRRGEWHSRFPSATHPLRCAAKSFPQQQFPLTKSYEPSYDFLTSCNLTFFGNETLICIGNDSAFSSTRRRSTSDTDNSVAKQERLETVMRAFLQKRMLSFVICTAVLCLLAAPAFLRADDEKDKNTAPSKAAPAKPDAPAPGLTERERMLLDSVELLEKRVAELEAKQPAGAPPT